MVPALPGADFNQDQLRFLSHIMRRERIDSAMKHSNVDSLTLNAWRQQETFRNAEAHLRSTASVLSPRIADDMAKAHDAWNVVQTIDIAENGRRDSDRLTALRDLRHVSGLQKARGGDTHIGRQYNTQINAEAIRWQVYQVMQQEALASAGGDSIENTRARVREGDAAGGAGPGLPAEADAALESPAPAKEPGDYAP